LGLDSFERTAGFAEARHRSIGHLGSTLFGRKGSRGGGAGSGGTVGNGRGDGESGRGRRRLTCFALSMNPDSPAKF
jgi:hypothetical protein